MNTPQRRQNTRPRAVAKVFDRTPIICLGAGLFLFSIALILRALP